MSVLVKGMEMPIGNCEWLDEYGHLKRCKLLNGEDCCKMQEHLTEVSTWQEQYARCPLVNVTTPHGALIDKDKLVKTTLLNPLHAPYITINDLEDQLVMIEAED